MLDQVQSEYIFKEIESTFALFDQTKSSLKVYQSLYIAHIRANTGKK